MLKYLLFLAFKYYFTPYSRGEQLIFPKGDARNGLLWRAATTHAATPPHQCHPPKTPFSPDTAPLATLPSPSPVLLRSAIDADFLGQTKRAKGLHEAHGW